MKTIFLLSLLYITPILAQEKISITNGTINFDASVPLFEEIKAENKKVKCILNLTTGEVSTTAFIKDFEFKIDLMETHFNENYMESDEYPQATFKGIIEGFNWHIIGNEPKEFTLKGILKLHGKSQKINTIVVLKKLRNGLEMVSDFNISTKDFNIKIPEIVSMKIAENVKTKTLFFFERSNPISNP